MFNGGQGDKEKKTPADEKKSIGEREASHSILKVRRFPPGETAMI